MLNSKKDKNHEKIIAFDEFDVRCIDSHKLYSEYE